ncbi:MAG: 2,3-bisphosphoglycerate-independent phosphoglycerate mutase [Elusimicrobia bacterium]|nr:2,3-bisphosphoglycerate-independent phosphoglycerate mutase [Elusimicrobiota bacterium]
MNTLDLVKQVAQKNDKKILMVVIDGLGGMPNPETGKTELDTAKTPNLDALAKKSAAGLTVPVEYGITPGSGPAHLSLFGYDPEKYQIGRGVLEAIGIGIHMKNIDLALRGNFATMDYSKNMVTDRRAGRIPTEKNQEICELLQEKIPKIEDCEVIIKSGKEHRFVVVFRGEGLSENITDNDPQKENNPAKKIIASKPDGKKTAEIVNKFIERVSELLKDKPPANYCLLRGFSKYPDIPQMGDVYQLKPAAIATYPMYRGLAQLVGMTIIQTPGETIEDEITVLKKEWNNYDFFYVHIKKTDAYGEDGNFDAKVKKIEEIDKLIPEFVNMKADSLIICGDHSTPAMMSGHSWHPVPFMLYSKYSFGNETIQGFSERECLKGALGIFRATNVMSLAMAHAMKLGKFGA